MNIFSKQNIPPPGSNDIVCRIALWGPVLTLLIFLMGLVVGIAFFISSYHASTMWGMVLSGIYILILWGLCRILYRALMAARSPANWLARIGPDGMLLKYRSYLHDDSPDEDLIALYLSWNEIVDAQLQQEIHVTTDIDEKREHRRWFLTVKMHLQNLDIEKIKSALEAENQRKPADFKVRELQNNLFNARKNKAAKSEIERIKQEIVIENKRHTGKRYTTHFHDRPITFIKPDKLRMEWTHITPGKKKLRQLLTQYTTVMNDQAQRFEIEKKMKEKEFKSLLATLISRDETLEAVKLVRLQRGGGIVEAKAFIEQTLRQDTLRE